MKSTTAAFTICLATALAACGSAPPETAKVLPEPLQANKNETALLTVTAKGDELYECQRAQDATFAWVATGPEARLVDAQGQLVGVAFPGPGWQYEDGSWVIGDAEAEAFHDAKALPWTRFNVKRTSGIGMLGKVSSIQSIETQGGAAPAETCDARNAGAGRLVPYVATLRFFVPDSASDLPNQPS